MNDDVEVVEVELQDAYSVRARWIKKKITSTSKFEVFIIGHIVFAGVIVGIQVGRPFR